MLTAQSAPGAAIDVRTRPTVVKLLTAGDVCAILSRSKRWLERSRLQGRFPAPDYQLGRYPRWKPSTVQAWLDAQSQQAQAAQ